MHLTQFAPNHIEFRQSLEEMSISAVKAQLTESVLLFGTAKKSHGDYYNDPLSTLAVTI